MTISRSAGEWPYLQAAAWLRGQIASGAIEDQLPPQMELAEQLGVAPRTIQKAVDILRDEGLVRSVAGLGVFVVKQ